MNIDRKYFYLIMVGLGSFGLMLPKVAGHITSGDAGELAMAGATLGVAHSPGYSIFVIFQYLLGKFLFFGNEAFRQNVACLIWSCLSLVMVGLILNKITRFRWTLFLGLPFLLVPQFRKLALVTEVFPLALFWGCLLIYVGLAYPNFFT